MTTSSLIRLDSLADRYRITREIGHGGMASVFLAHDLRHDRDVAIKVLHPELAAALGGDRFLAEIKTTARLQHPHILPLLDSGEADGHLFYVMPFVAGETLRARLEREHLLPINDALRIGREVADALEHAHNLGIVHRDIKPENILLQDGHALVADFGISLAVQQAGGARMTQTGLSLGTPQYMSPEQAMGERTIDGRSDVYALGAVVYEMLVGDPPFTGSTVQAIVARVMTERPARIATRRERVSPHVEAAVLRALEKLPADRWASAREFSEALDGAGAAWTVPEVQGTPSPEASTRRALPRVLLGAGIAACTLAAGWLGGRWTTRSSATAPLIATSILPPLDGSFGEQQSIALSPDGRRLAFVFAPNNSSQSLWVRSLDKLEAKQIPGGAGADIPFWSPDGRMLGFFARGALQVMDANGDIRQLCTVTQPSSASWSTGGEILFGHRGGVSIVAASGGTCRLIVPVGNNPTPRAAFLPDGKRFAYSRGRTGDLVIADHDGHTLGTLSVRPRVFAFVAPSSLVYPSEGDALAVDIRSFDTRTLAWSGTALRLLNGVRSGGGVNTFSVTASGALAYLPGSIDRAYLVFDAHGLADTVPLEGAWTISARRRKLGTATVALAGNTVGLWLYELEGKRATRVALHQASIVSNGRPGVGPTYPVFSPDGKRIAYTLNGLSSCSIAMHDLDADQDVVLMHAPVATLPMPCPAVMDWFPDARRFLIRRDTVLEVVTLEGATVSSISRPGRIWEGHLSPDGNSVAYASDETGRAEVYVQSLPTGLPTRISLEGGRWPGWSEDGHTLYFMTPDGRIQKAAVSGTSLVGTPKTVLNVPTWRRSIFDDNGVGFAVVGNGEQYIVRQSPSALAVAYVQNWRSLLAR